MEKEKKMTVDELERRLFLGEEQEDELLERYPELIEELGARETQRVADYLAGRLDPAESQREELEKIKKWTEEKAGTP